MLLIKTNQGFPKNHSTLLQVKRLWICKLSKFEVKQMSDILSLRLGFTMIGPKPMHVYSKAILKVLPYTWLAASKLGLIRTFQKRQYASFQVKGLQICQLSKVEIKENSPSLCAYMCRFGFNHCKTQPETQNIRFLFYLKLWQLTNSQPLNLQ